MQIVTLAALLVACLWECKAAPGTWELISVAQSETYSLQKIGWYPKGRRSVIFGMQACQEVTITMYGRDATNYIVIYLGYYSNAYVLVIPSSDCDASGSCSLNNFAAGAFLDCNTFKFFWMQWDDQGNFAIGTDYTIGQNTLITLPSNGLFEEAFWMDLMVGDASGGAMYLYVDDPPEWEYPAPDGSTEVSVQETDSGAKVLTTFKATDPEGDPVTAFMMEHTDLFQFTMTDLLSIGPLDYETNCIHVITVSVHDGLNIVNTTLTVRLVNVYDEAPSVDSTTVYLPEELAVGTFIDGGYTVSDIEEGDQLTYTLSGTHASYFDVTTDGRLKIASRINFDSGVTLLDQLNLTVTDLGSNTNSTTLTFRITDVNDNKPTFSLPVYEAEVVEGAGASVSLLQLTVVDDDDTVNAQYDVTMDGDDAVDPKFTLNPSTLELTVNADKLDYESLEAEGFIYKLNFVATDKATDFQPMSGTTVAVIKIKPLNEFTPVWTSAPVDMSVDEDTAPGSTLAQYTATDDDLSKDGDITYTIADVRDDSGTQRLDMFHLDSANGQLILSSLLDADVLTGGVGYYDVTLQAADNGDTPNSVGGAARITLNNKNDNPPVFANVVYEAEVAEDVSVGSVVVSVTASDADGGTISYTITGDGQGVFDHSTDVVTKTSLDHEEQAGYAFTLIADDGVHQTATAIYVNITNVIDETPVLTISNPISLVEELPVGTPLGGIYDVTDRDVDDSFTYSLSGADSSYFSIDAATGLISVAQRIDRDSGLASLSSVVITVNDAGANQASGTVTFNIQDLNDNSPQFSSDTIFIDIPENEPPSNVLQTLAVTDADDGNNAHVVLSIIGGDDANPNEKFSVNTASELMTTSNPVDYESLESAGFKYVLTVQAVDQPTTEAAKTSIVPVVVTIRPNNEFTPVWAVTPVAMTVSETSPPGTTLAQYTATDDDLGTDGELHYQLTAVDDTGADGSSKFDVDTCTGDFILASTLDYDAATGGVKYYDVTLKAVDGGVTTNVKSVETTIRVTLTAENDNAPFFPDPSYLIPVAEDVHLNSVILSVAATDHDGDALTYSVLGDGQGTFDYVTDLTNTAALDYERRDFFNFKLSVSDGVHDVTVDININVTNVFDVAPVISVSNPINIVEELPVGTALGDVYVVSDIEHDDVLTYSLEGTDSPYFSIDTNTGVISVAQRIDRETIASLTQVTLKVSDAGSNMASETLSFTVLDINDNIPQFQEDVIFINVTENTPADQILETLVCSDIDDGNNAIFNFAIKSGDVAPDRFKLVNLDLKTTSQAVNYEDAFVPGNMYTLTITAEDTPTAGDPLSSPATVIINVVGVNEFDPQITAPSSTGVALSETTLPGTLIETFVATDDDAGPDGELEYMIVDVLDPSSTSATSMFEIDHLSGKLRLAQELDADTVTGGVAYYDIEVKVSDKGSPSRSSAQFYKVTIQNENDIAPVFVDFTHIIDIPENTAISDVMVTLTTKDDDGDSVTVDLVDGDVGMFSVSGHDIVLQQLLDYETSAGHVLVISITDGLHTVNTTLVIRVSDVIDEPPVIETFVPGVLIEELPVGTEVDGLYHVTDLDRGDTFTFTLTGSDSSLFTINSTTGQIALAQRIDLEALSGRSLLDQLTLSVTDSGGLQDTAQLSVEVQDINDAYPVFEYPVYKVNISESSSTEVLVDFVCTDSDSGPNGQISIQITDGDDPSSKFSMSGTELSALGGNLDYESLESTQYMYILTVAATDSPVSESPKTGITLVVVTILPVNEHDPNWDSSMSISAGSFPDLTMLENVTVGSDLITLKAEDADHGQDGVISYHISSVTTNVGTSAPDLFSVDASSGALRIARNLDRDITSGAMYYTLDLVARDGGNPSRETSASLKVILDNVNDNSPVFYTTDYEVSVAEDAVLGTTVHTFTDATDLDGDSITYTVEGGANSVFGISGTDVTTLVELDYESIRCYSLIIKASDGLYNETIVMVVSVTDVVDEIPQLIPINAITIPEETPVGSRVPWMVNVTDADEGDVLSYTISGADAGLFAFDSATGVLTTAQRLDRETRPTISDITIRVADSAGLGDDFTMTVTLADINDHAPTFAEDVHIVYVEEGGTGEVDLVTLALTDLDMGDNSNYDVTITSGNDGSEFRLDGMVLKVDSSLIDYENPSFSNFTYVVTINAVDKPTDGSALTGETTIVVHVGPLNEFTPAWTSPTPTAGAFPDVTIPESATPLVSSLVTYTTSDNDHGEHGHVTYTITAATAANGDDATHVFVMEGNSGQLWMTQAPDADSGSGGSTSYDLTIKAEDGDLKSVQATQKILITNTNDNPPTVTPSFSQIEVAESTVIGTVVFNLNVYDVDGDTTTPTIIEGDGYFALNSFAIETAAHLDFETQQCHTVIVSISDGVHDVNFTLSVNVTNENDNFPEVTLFGAVTVPEELPIGTIIGGIYDVIDRDEGDVVSLSVSGVDSHYVEVDTASGELKVKSRIDRDGAAGVTSLDDLTLTATDTAGHTTNVNFNISVLDINDNPPMCDESTYIINITEHSSDGIVTTLTCSDGDSGDNGNFVVTVTGGDVNGFISMSGLDVIATGSTMDYEAVDESVPYVVTLTAVDQPTSEAAKSTAVSLIIQILPQNEFDPVWQNPAIDASLVFTHHTVSESMPPGSVVVNFTATDDDAGTDGDLKYHIVSAMDENLNDRKDLFVLDETWGTLRTSGILDRDPPSGFETVSVKIQATDMGNPARSAVGTMVIYLTAENDNPPTFDNLPYELDVKEDEVIGTEMLKLQASDVDGDTVTFGMSGSDAATFQIDGTSLKLLQNLDYESQQCYVLQLTASDGVYEVNATLVINVTNENDNSPEVTLYGAVSVPEELPVGTLIGGIYDVIDKDEGDVVTLAVSGVDSQYVEVDTASGELKVKSRIDRDGATGVTSLDDLTLTVTDTAGHTTIVSFNISVLDINDNPPVCDESTYIINITEHSSDGIVATLTCSDGDSGDNGNFVVTVTGGDVNGYISMSGLDVIATGSTMDYEAVDESVPYVVTLTAVDQPTTEAAKSTAVSLIIQILPDNEFDPVWFSPAVDGSLNFPGQSVSESARPGSVIVNFTATDDDAGVDGDVIYHVVSAVDEHGQDRKNSFMLDEATGILRSSKTLDRDPPDGMEKVTLVVQATDMGSPARSTTGTVVIDITAENDNAPVFVDLPSEIDIFEHEGTGTEVLNLQANDVDGDAVDFEMSGSEAHLFQIVGSSLKLFNNLDYESKQCHVLELRAKDGVYTTNMSLTVNVLNVVDEVPVITLSTILELAEEQPIGMAVGGFFSVTDRDIGDNLTYSLTGSGSQFFNVSASGEFTIIQRIDHDDGTSGIRYIDDLTLTVTDSGGLQDTVTLNISVIDTNDNIPVCSVTPGQVNVTENTAADELLSQITCTDADDGNYGTIGLSLDPASDPGGHFKLSGDQLMTDANPMDYDTMAPSANSMLTVKVVASDNIGGLISHTATIAVAIMALPENEFYPAFITPPVDGSGNFNDVTLPEDTAVGSVILTFTASDNDLGRDGDVMYSISSVTSDVGDILSGVFIMDSSTGDLRVSSDLDIDMDTGGVSFYTVNITASDSGDPPLSTSGTLKVTLTGANDNAPEFNMSSLDMDVFENASIGDVVLTLAALDIDGDSMTFTSSHPLFEVVGADLKIKSQLDYEQERCHTVIISATDSKHVTNTTLTIGVLDSNDESPVITVLGSMVIPEELAVGTPVARGYVASDADQDDSLTYSIQGTDASYLNINSSTGEITIQSRMDFESIPSPGSLDITLKVTDVVGHTVTQALHVALVDINDNSPVFDQSSYFTTVKENASSETLLVTLASTDVDTGINGVVTYNITDDSSGGLFRLDSDNLYISVVDYDTSPDTMFTLTVTAYDSGDVPNSAVAVVVVEIQPVNEYEPIWQTPAIDGSGRFPDVTFGEDEPPGHLVMTYTAADQDLGVDGEVWFSIVSVVADTGGNGDPLFSINSNTGELTTCSSLDFDTSTGGVNYYDITLEVSDKGNQTRTANGVQRVNINNINDIAPVFTQPIYQVNVACDEIPATILTTLAAVDDEGDALAFSLETGSNSFVTLTSSADVVFKARPPGSSVTDLAQSISVVVSDQGTPELKTKGRLLVLFDNCANSTVCANVTNVTTTEAATTSSTITTTTPLVTTAPIVTTASAAPANCTPSPPCECNSTVVAGNATVVAGPPVEDVVEAWAMRVMVMALAATLLASALCYFRPRTPPRPKKVFPRQNNLERGISDDVGRPFDDLENHILHK